MEYKSANVIIHKASYCFERKKKLYLKKMKERRFRMKRNSNDTMFATRIQLV